jgi:hypothetical protein
LQLRLSFFLLKIYVAQVVNHSQRAQYNFARRERRNGGTAQSPIPTERPHGRLNGSAHFAHDALPLQRSGQQSLILIGILVSRQFAFQELAMIVAGGKFFNVRRQSCLPGLKLLCGPLLIVRIVKHRPNNNRHGDNQRAGPAKE